MSGAVGFVLNGKRYDLASIDRLTLRDALRFDREAEREDYGITWSGLLALAEQAASLPPEQAMTHGGTWLLLGATVWATRREAGEDLTFGEAIGFRFGEVQWIRQPEDRKPDPHKARPNPRKGSGRAVARGAAAEAGTR